MTDATMTADLTARLEALQRQHSDHLALLQTAMALGRVEGQMAALREVLAGLTPDEPDPPAEDDESV